MPSNAPSRSGSTPKASSSSGTLAGHHPSVVRDRRDRAPWYTTKRHPSYLDMIVKLRRVLIAAQYQPEVPDRPTNEEIRVVQLAWAQAVA